MNLHKSHGKKAKIGFSFIFFLQSLKVLKLEKFYSVTTGTTAKAGTVTTTKATPAIVTGMRKTSHSPSIYRSVDIQHTDQDLFCSRSVCSKLARRRVGWCVNKHGNKNKQSLAQQLQRNSTSKPWPNNILSKKK